MCSAPPAPAATVAPDAEESYKVTLYEAILAQRGQAHFRKWHIKRSQVKQEYFEWTCPDGCRHIFSTDLVRLAKPAAEHDTARMLRKLGGEHSDEEGDGDKKRGIKLSHFLPHNIAPEKKKQAQMSNAHEVLAAAMGRTVPLPAPDTVPLAATATRVEMDLYEEKKEEILKHASDALYWAGRARNAALVLAVLLAVWVLYILFNAYRRYRGPQLAPVPLSYKQQRHVLVNYTAGARQKK